VALNERVQIGKLGLDEAGLLQGHEESRAVRLEPPATVIDGNPWVLRRSVLDQPGLAFGLALGLAQRVGIPRPRDRVEDWSGADDSLPQVLREMLLQLFERIGLTPTRAENDVDVSVFAKDPFQQRKLAEQNWRAIPVGMKHAVEVEEQDQLGDGARSVWLVGHHPRPLS